MRRYRIASWILLIHSIINFTLAVPVAVGDIHRVRVNVVDAAKDRIDVLQKRMNEGGEGRPSDLTSEHGAPGPDPDPDPDSDSDSEKDSSSSSSSDDSDGGEAAQQWEEEFQNYEPSDIEEEDNSEEDNHEEDNHDDDNHDEYDSEEDDREQSPPRSPESQYPAGSTYEDLWSKLLKGSLRPRTPTSGAVDAPKRESQEIDDTRSDLPLFPFSCQLPNNSSHKYSDPLYLHG